jgi:uncharacterized protein YggU (UPF0235/DUF167 family)
VITPSGLEVYTQEPMENNRANLDIIRQLAVFYGISTASVRIVMGSRKRRKVVEINL